MENIQIEKEISQEVNNKEKVLESLSSILDGSEVISEIERIKDRKLRAEVWNEMKENKNVKEFWDKYILIGGEEEKSDILEILNGKKDKDEDILFSLN